MRCVQLKMVRSAMISAAHAAFFTRTLAFFLLLSVLFLTSCQPSDHSAGKAPSFTLAVIPDTQNAVDYTHQKSAGFALDSSELFIQQMRYIADHSVARGGDIAFAAAVGDVWQHQSKPIDPAHAARGITAIDNPYFAIKVEWTPQTLAFEVPKAIEGYRILHEAGLPFGVAPGNHDYDAMWSVAGFPPNVNKLRSELTHTVEDLGLLHIGGLDNFRSAFGDQSDFFKDKPWYIDSFRGGANSAQRFSAAGYTFLHITLEMQAGDDVLAWIESVLEKNPGLPTILTTHDFLDTYGRRAASPIVDLKRVDEGFHNSAEDIWQKLIRRHDQIFLVLSGHHHAQSMRVDNNDSGHAVYQILADYQARGQVGIDHGQPLSAYTGRPEGTGDGWFRLMNFSMSEDYPRIEVETFSSYYNSRSADLAQYVGWYRHHEHPQMSDAQFHAADHYTLELKDFYRRFGRPALD